MNNSVRKLAVIAAFFLLPAQAGKAESGYRGGLEAGSSEDVSALKRDYLRGAAILSSSALARELAAIQAGRLPSELLSGFLERIDRASQSLGMADWERSQARALYGWKLRPPEPRGSGGAEAASRATRQERASAVLNRALDMAARLGRAAETQAPSIGGAVEAARNGISYGPGFAKARLSTPPLTRGRTPNPAAILPPLRRDPPLPQRCKYIVLVCEDELPGIKYATVSGRIFVLGEENSAVVVPDDVSQGLLGDCYFLASLAAVARKHPDKIRDMIKPNEDGTFTVAFYNRRSPWEFWKPEFERMEVRIDGKLPMFDGVPVYARYGRRLKGLSEIWPMVAEKGYASYWGSYGRIGLGGWPDLALEEITGRPSERHPASSVSVDLMAHWDSMGRVMVVATKQGSRIFDEPLYRTQLLVPQHAYWVESVDDKRKIVTLANPWGWDWPHVVLTEQEFRRVLDHIYVNPVR